MVAVRLAGARSAADAPRDHVERAAHHRLGAARSSSEASVPGVICHRAGCAGVAACRASGQGARRSIAEHRGGVLSDPLPQGVAPARRSFSTGGLVGPTRVAASATPSARPRRRGTARTAAAPAKCRPTRCGPRRPAGRCPASFTRNPATLPPWPRAAVTTRTATVPVRVLVTGDEVDDHLPGVRQRFPLGARDPGSTAPGSRPASAARRRPSIARGRHGGRPRGEPHDARRRWPRGALGQAGGGARAARARAGSGRIATHPGGQPLVGRRARS